MLSSVLRSPTAVSVSIRIMESFVKLRQFLMKNSYMFQRMNVLEVRLAETESKVDNIMKMIDNNQHNPVQGIFFDGRTFPVKVRQTPIMAVRVSHGFPAFPRSSLTRHARHDSLPRPFVPLSLRKIARKSKKHKKEKKSDGAEVEGVGNTGVRLELCENIYY